MMSKIERPLQWHPVFYARLQIELKEERDNLIFENIKVQRIILPLMIL